MTSKLTKVERSKRFADRVFIRSNTSSLLFSDVEAAWLAGYKAGRKDERAKAKKGKVAE
jgi:hypothetical protein